MNVIKRWLQKHKSKAQATGETDFLPKQKKNPYLPYIREILEEVLKQRGLDYGTMRLLVVDTDQEPESFFEEDEVTEAMKQLSPDLNFFTILTERPAYFQEYVETMYEETGLPVQVEGKGGRRKTGANTVLDFEQSGELLLLDLTEPSIYIPIYKRSWETAENLDIYVPIGYNIVIVKGIRVVEKRGRML